MNTLVIYDETGRIYYQASGNVQEPTGIPFLWVEIPAGKRLKSINTAVTPHEPVLLDIMGIDPDSCTLDELKFYLVDKSKGNLENYLETNPIKSTAHGEFEKLYSITKEKQSLLTQMIMITQVAAQSGIEYQPSWNAQGEPCTYDWTLPELQQLAFEIERIVRPLVSHQQEMEAAIYAAETKEVVIAISITF